MWRRCLAMSLSIAMRRNLSDYGERICWYVISLMVFLFHAYLHFVSIFVPINTFSASEELSASELKSLEEAVQKVHVKGVHPLSQTLHHRLLTGGVKTCMYMLWF